MKIVLCNDITYTVILIPHTFDNIFVEEIRKYCVQSVYENRCHRRTTHMRPIDLSQDNPNPRFNNYYSNRICVIIIRIMHYIFIYLILLFYTIKSIRIMYYIFMYLILLFYIIESNEQCYVVYNRIW